MFNMAYNNVNNGPQGFHVFQTTLGAPLEFHPALGTAELDEMMDAYVAGFAPIQDKRAAISLDFFEHLSLTGETIKFYPVNFYSFASTTSSPASLQDSGYGSSFSASPLAPTWNWGQVAQASPASFSSHQSPPSQPHRQHAASARKSTIAAAHSRASDFSHLPGMKILTKDGLDVTNAASRGSKTKEQRDHAHLMRIIKACDSCRRKKIRCDPSHKSREALKSRSQEAPRALANNRHATRKPQSERSNLLVDAHSLARAPPSIELPVHDLDMLDAVNVNAWEDLVHLDQPISAPTAPDDYDFFNDPNGLFSPASDSVSSSTPASQQFTPTSPQSASITRLPRLPYLDDSGLPHEYIDFNLYSPASSLADDDLPVFGESSLHTLGADVPRHNLPISQDGICSSSSPIESVHGLPSNQPLQLASSARQTLEHSATDQSSSQASPETNLLAPTGSNSASQTRATLEPLCTHTPIDSSFPPALAIPGTGSQFKADVLLEESRQQTGHLRSTATPAEFSMPHTLEVSTAIQHSDVEENAQFVSQGIATRTAATTVSTVSTTLDPTGRNSCRRACATQNSGVGRRPDTLPSQAVSSVMTLDDTSRRPVDSISGEFSPPTPSIAGANQHGVTVPLQLLAMSFMAMFWLRGEKSSMTITSWTKTPPTIMFSLASALAVGVLLHAIVAPSHLWSDILKLKESLPGLAFCAFAFITSRSVGNNVGKGEAVDRVPTFTCVKQEMEGVADGGDGSSGGREEYQG